MRYSSFVLCAAFVWFLAAAGNSSGEASHHPQPGDQYGGDGEAPLEKDSVKSDTLVVFPRQTGRKSGEEKSHNGSDGDGNGAKDSVKNGNKGPNTPMEASGHPLFVFAYDPASAASPAEKETIHQSILLKEAAKRKVQGARIIDVAPLSAKSLETAFDEARKNDPDNASLITSAVLIVNVKSRWSSDSGLAWDTKSGKIPEAQWMAAIRKLSKTIFGETSRGKLETILLTDQSGLIHCERFPGPVFGISPAGFPLDRESLLFWTDYQVKKADALFPMTAKEWYESWAFTNKVSRRRYFYCPTKNVKGYLGYKTKSDPVGDNGGVGWDINSR